MGNKREEMTGKLKIGVRYLRVEEAVFMVLTEDAMSESVKWGKLSSNADGFRLELICKKPEKGKKSSGSFSRSWKSVANTLGVETCEYVLNPDGTKCVLLYDEVALADDIESPKYS